MRENESAAISVGEDIFYLDLVAGYGKKTVVRSVDFEIAAGEIVTIFGHDGAGKTTLLRAMFGLTRPRAGEVRLAGSIITGASLR